MKSPLKKDVSQMSKEEQTDLAKQEAKTIGSCLAIIFGVPFLIGLAVVILGFILAALK